VTKLPRFLFWCIWYGKTGATDKPTLLGREDVGHYESDYYFYVYITPSTFVALLRKGTDPDYGPGATRDGGGWVSEKPRLDFPMDTP